MSTYPPHNKYGKHSPTLRDIGYSILTIMLRPTLQRKLDEYYDNLNKMKETKRSKKTKK